MLATPRPAAFNSVIELLQLESANLPLSAAQIQRRFNSQEADPKHQLTLQEINTVLEQLASDRIVRLDWINVPGCTSDDEQLLCVFHVKNLLSPGSSTVGLKRTAIHSHDQKSFLEQFIETELYSKPTSIVNKDSWWQRHLPSAYLSNNLFRKICPRLLRQDCDRHATSFPCNLIHFKISSRSITHRGAGFCSYIKHDHIMERCDKLHIELDTSSENDEIWLHNIIENAKQNTAFWLARMNFLKMNNIQEEFPDGELRTMLHFLTYMKWKSQSEKKFILDKIDFNSWTSNLGRWNPGLAAQVPPQWIECDVRTFDFSIIQNVSVVMADPPWDINMSLPYGTMHDQEMKEMKVQNIHSDGYIFLWATLRTLELARECLQIWGYKIIDEIVWIKLNQAQQIPRSGTTGYWLNHAKEHCLVGIKGNPKDHFPCLDCDVIASETRETSRKPDEIYGIIDRLCPSGRKVELFGRLHNVRPGWITLGNQLGSVCLYPGPLQDRYLQRYPNGAL